MIAEYLGGGAVISLVILCWKMNRDTNGKFVRKDHCKSIHRALEGKVNEIKNSVNLRIDDVKSHIDIRFKDLQKYLSDNGFKK